MDVAQLFHIPQQGGVPSGYGIGGNSNPAQDQIDLLKLMQEKYGEDFSKHPQIQQMLMQQQMTRPAKPSDVQALDSQAERTLKGLKMSALR